MYHWWSRKAITYMSGSVPHSAHQPPSIFGTNIFLDISKHADKGVDGTSDKT